MGWIVFMILAYSTALILVPFKHWKKSWPVGVLSMVSIYSIDSTLVYLGAFKFFHGGIYVSDLPLYYWLSYFPGGIIFDYLRPRSHIRKPCYILIMAALYLFIELTMIYTGYFDHFSWNPYRSYLLNTCGFTIAMWFAEWMEEGRSHGTAEKDF